MAAAFRSVAGLPAISRTNMAMPVPAGVVAGDRLVAVTMTYNSGTTISPTAPAGWTAFSGMPLIMVNSTNSARINLFWRDSTGSEPATYTFTHVTQEEAGGYMFAVSGAALGSEPTISGTPWVGTGTTSTAQGITIAANDAMVAFCAAKWSPFYGTGTPPTGFTERRDPTDGYTYLATLDGVAAGATGNKTHANGNGTGTNPWAAVLVGFESAPSFALDQEGYAFFVSGAEDTAAFLGAQDTGITSPLDTDIQLRTLINSTLDTPATQYLLEYRLTGGTYGPVLTTSPTPSVAYGAVGTGSNGTTSCTPAYPTGILNYRCDLFCIVTGRSNTANTAATMPAGWTNVLTLEGGTGTWGADAGTRRVQIFKKDDVLGTESGTVTVSLAGTTANTLYASIHRIDHAIGMTLDVAASTGADTTSAVGFSATGGTALSWQAGDLLLVAVAQTTDTVTQSAQSITATGVTFGTRTNRASVAVSDGNDHRHIVDSVPVTTGSGSSAPIYAYTGSAAISGPVGFLRLRPVAPSLPIAMAALYGTFNTSTRLAVPAGKTVDYYQVGRITDTENPLPALDLPPDDYTEVAWAIRPQSPATNGQVYQFRVTENGLPLDTYSVTPELTVGSAGTISSATGTSSGSATVAATGTALRAGTGLSTGGSTVSGVGGSTARAAGASSATSTASAVTGTIRQASGSSTGGSTVTGVGGALRPAAAASSGSSTVTGVAASTARTVGVSTATAVVVGSSSTVLDDSSLIFLYLSGGASNALTSSSLGGAKSSVLATGSLFSPVIASQFASSTSLYRCVYVQVDASIADVKARVLSDTPSSVTAIALGWGVASINAPESTIANQTTAPAGVTFSSPASLAEAPSGGSFTSGQYRSLWIRYTTVGGTGSINSETFTLEVAAISESFYLLTEISDFLVDGSDRITQ